ncbi:hypothetical protein FOMG_10175 [Fusarium oxysporum f. sp. melonis 26406]|nr:hypothetical protein FOMG_10175 [Fusarium oxysporum f. sp. melonis 26406]KAJ9418213.1 hypothetical protein QL093DRAFT_2380319 [Fusarium oxysporum]
MALAITDPFNRLPPELRLRVLISSHYKLSTSRIIEASPIMLQQYLAHKKYIVRQVLAAELDAQMIQDAMAITLFRRSQPTRAHFRAWSKSDLPNPLKEIDDHLVGELDKLYRQILLLVEDYITKATASLAPQAYLCLPQVRQPSIEGHIMFKGAKVAPRFDSDKLTFSERKRFFKAFLTYELLRKAGYSIRIPRKLRKRKVSNAEYEAVGCVHSYVCSLYGAMLAQCNDADLSTASAAPPLRTDTFSPIPDAVYFAANPCTPNIRLFTDSYGHDIGASFSTLGLDRLTDFLRYDMAKPEERKTLYKQLKHVWEFEEPSDSDAWDKSSRPLLKSKPKYKNGDESSMYKQLSLHPGEKLRYRVGQQRAWVFFDNDRFYPQESPERPNFPSERSLAEKSFNQTFSINDWFHSLKNARILQRG